MPEIYFTPLSEAIPTLFILITIFFLYDALAPGSPFYRRKRALPPEVPLGHWKQNII